MSRPLLQFGIIELEALFAKSKRNMQALKNLEAELEFRQVPRARSLLASVRTVINATHAMVPSDAELGPAVADRSSATLTQPEQGLFNSARSAPPEITRPASIGSKQASQSREDGPPIPLSEAYRLLKANPGSSWDSIELVRQQLVQRASPAVATREQQARLQEESNRINAAYKAIVVARVQGQ